MEIAVYDCIVKLLPK